MADKLDGSFSGLWTCELCSKTGADCTCEHFKRVKPCPPASDFGYAYEDWMEDRSFERKAMERKSLTEPELMAEVWYARCVSNEAFDDYNYYGTEERLNKFHVEENRMYVLQDLAGAEVGKFWKDEEHG